jgi:hypothetical protein
MRRLRVPRLIDRLAARGEAGAFGCIGRNMLHLSQVAALHLAGCLAGMDSIAT